MSEDLPWVPAGIDTSIPNVARVYDYLLGGGHNFEADRQLAEVFDREIMPGAREIVRLSRAFLHRAVDFLVDSGIRQFLDLGSGIPTVGNVHEIAEQATSESRVVYVDKDPLAVAHSRLMLQGNDRATAIQADLCDVDDILGHPETRRLLDFDEPIALLTLMVWHFVPETAHPKDVLARYRAAVVPGSFLAISHFTLDAGEPGRVVEEFEARSRDHVYPRSYDQLLDLLEGFELVDPGLVACAAWRPRGPGDISDDPLVNGRVYGAVCRKP
ncbi:SAM-dependent methyltransferase [Longimycelium tulufanense]|uniref:SAM-dependent methyltransferase n=1 Tax=Longimycelium tulufanense TaxID=907463 RepID=UPI00166622DE|nr:SAM-dependent methyltransferase [Longimycelium tulufanense]